MNYELAKENTTKLYSTFVDATNAFYNRCGSDAFRFIDTTSLERDRECVLLAVIVVVVIVGDDNGNVVVASLLCHSSCQHYI